MSGFAIGAAATVLAFVAINPTGTPSTNTSNQAAGDNSSILLPSDGGQITAPAVGQTKTLSNGTKLTTLSNGSVVATDTSGQRIRCKEIDRNRRVGRCPYLALHA